MMHRNSFHRRLRWRDHFLQKFESLPWMEFRCINPSRENLRGWDGESYERWVTGTTGYPFVDACMRSLNATKWINFRARAMLVSFASYALGLDWRGFAPHLARTFLDYEPGIHYSQFQMQSGTTIGSIPRIYNPVKQSLEKDPAGEFIRRWVPELRGLQGASIHIPGETSRRGYPAAIIRERTLRRIMRSNAPGATTANEPAQMELGFQN
jgi:deoxyribodipyrimidine photo-lyase